MRRAVLHRLPHRRRTRHPHPPRPTQPSAGLEVTENIVLADADLILEHLQQLRACGLGIAFDDFGTGYAS